MSSVSSGSFFPSIRQTPLWIWCAHTLSPSWNKAWTVNSSTDIPENLMYVCVGVCAPTFRHLSMFSVEVLLSGSGTNMSTFKQHDIMLQEEHTPDWYFQSAGLAVLWNSQWHWYDSSIKHCAASLSLNMSSLRVHQSVKMLVSVRHMFES